jgi:hypothetical protein
MSVRSWRRVSHVLVPCTRGALALALLAELCACKDPTSLDTRKVGPASGGLAELEETLHENCPAGDDWIPADGGPTPPVRMFDPAPHPDTECPFYRGAYQNFMIAAAPLPNGDPLLVEYPTIDDAFHSAKAHLPRNTGDPSADPHDAAVRAGPATGRAWLGAVRQAGQRNVLVDQDDHTLFYGLHMNQAFVDFVVANGLDTIQGIQDVPPMLAFPPGVVEFKTAWKDIDPQDFPGGAVPPPPMGDFATVGPALTWDHDYITTTAWVPYLTQDAQGVVHEDRDHPLLRRVALIAVHAVYTLPGHPEFIWGSIQHVNVNAIDPAVQVFGQTNVYGAPDSQPNGIDPKTNLPNKPSLDDSQNSRVMVPASHSGYLLYKAGTPLASADQPIATSSLELDEPTQSFPHQAESVYRMFPGSKSSDLAPDSAVFSLNSNVGKLFANAIAAKTIDPQVDKRQNYRLVAAVWMDKPYFFDLGADGTGATFQNDATNPLVIGALQKPPNLYLGVSQGNFCGTPLDSTNTSGDSPQATGANNSVPGCSTRADALANGDDPMQLFATEKAGTDSEFSLLGGEDRLSSTAMETFTQNGAFNNCFTCHNTRPVNSNGVPAQEGDTPLLAKPALINVSHMFSEFVLREQEEATETTSGQ